MAPRRAAAMAIATKITRRSPRRCSRPRRPSSRVRRCTGTLVTWRSRARRAPSSWPQRAGLEGLAVELQPGPVGVGREIAHAPEHRLHVDSVERHAAPPYHRRGAASQPAAGLWACQIGYMAAPTRDDRSAQGALLGVVEGLTEFIRCRPPGTSSWPRSCSISAPRRSTSSSSSAPSSPHLGVSPDAAAAGRRGRRARQQGPALHPARPGRVPARGDRRAAGARLDRGAPLRSVDRGRQPRGGGILILLLDGPAGGAASRASRT